MRLIRMFLDGGAIAVEDEDAAYHLGRGQLAEALLQLCRHPRSFLDEGRVGSVVQLPCQYMMLSC